MNLGSVPTVPGGDTLLNTATAPGRPGSPAWGRDGRRFRLVKNGAVALVASNVVQASAINVGHIGLTPTADLVAGAKTVRVTAGAGAGTNAPANTYAGGLLMTGSAPSSGQSYAIKSHEAIVATQPFTIVLESDDPIVVALPAVSVKIDLLANPYNGVVVTLGTAATSQPVGVAVAAIDPGNWGYVVVEGLAEAIADAAVAVGQAVSPSITTPGLVSINSGTLPIIGSCVRAATGAGTVVGLSLTLP